MNRTPAEICQLAAGLISEDDDNPEYDRAIAELTCDLLGFPLTDYKEEVLRMLRRGWQIQCCDEHPYCDLCGEDRVRWSFDHVGVCDDCLPNVFAED